MSGSRTLPVIGVTAILLTGCGSATAPAGADRFEIPTFAWDKGGGNQALIEGVLSFTDDGCPLMVSDHGYGPFVEPILFPNAVGVRFDNGVRGVIEADTGKLYAVEGQRFGYAGGGGAAPEPWTALCEDFSPDAITYVNDLPSFETLQSPPSTPDPSLPTQLPTREERGWYAVPTFEWNPAEGGDGALLEGTVSMTADGCAVIAGPDGVIGLVLPNAWGARENHYAPEVAIYSWFPDGGMGAMAEDGVEVSFGGGFGELTGEFGEQWTHQCPHSPVDGLFLVQDTDTMP